MLKCFIRSRPDNILQKADVVKELEEKWYGNETKTAKTYSEIYLKYACSKGYLKRVSPGVYENILNRDPTISDEQTKQVDKDRYGEKDGRLSK